MGLTTAHLNADTTPAATVVAAVVAEAVSAGWTDTTFSIVGGLTGHRLVSPGTQAPHVILWEQSDRLTRMALAADVNTDTSVATDYAQKPLSSNVPAYDADGSATTAWNFSTTNPNTSSAIHVVEIEWSTVSDVYVAFVDDDYLALHSTNDEEGGCVEAYIALGPNEPNPVGLRLLSTADVGLTHGSNQGTWVHTNQFATAQSGIFPDFDALTDYAYDNTGLAAGYWMISRGILFARYEALEPDKDLIIGYTRNIWEARQAGTTLAPGDVVVVDGTTYMVCHQAATVVRLMRIS